MRMYVPRWKAKEFLHLNHTQALVQNTWYTVIDNNDIFEKDLHSMTLYLTIADETIELEMTIDTTVVAVVVALAVSFDTMYAVRQGSDGVFNIVANPMDGVSTPFRENVISCRRLKIRVRKTTATGAGTLYTDLWYSKVSA